MTIEEIIRAVQSSLNISVDGKAGPETWLAIYQKTVAAKIKGNASAMQLSIVDPRSEKCIETLLPEVQNLARTLVQQAASAGIFIKIISGFRTYAEQDALYAQGRTAPGEIVTNAKGGESNHNFKIGFDVGIFSGSKYLPDSPKYKAVGIIGATLGLEWGGNWTDFVDQSHFQLRPNWAKDMSEKKMLAELRRRAELDIAVFS